MEGGRTEQPLAGSALLQGFMGLGCHRRNAHPFIFLEATRQEEKVVPDDYSVLSVKSKFEMCRFPSKGMRDGDWARGAWT
jgi:hypothetical protein